MIPCSRENSIIQVDMLESKDIASRPLRPKRLYIKSIIYLDFLKASMISLSVIFLNESIIFLTMYEGVLSSKAPSFSRNSNVSSSILTDIIFSFLAIVKSMNNTLYDIILQCMTIYDKGVKWHN